MMRLVTKMLAVCLLLVLRVSHAQAVDPIRVCGDPNPVDWMTPEQRKDHYQTYRISGISIEIVKATFKVMGRSGTFIGSLPWNRCLSEVENGNVEFAMGAYFNEARSEIFDYSVHYNTLTPQIFYLKSKPVIAADLSELRRYRGCGLIGSSYSHYGLKEDELDLASGYDSLLRRLRAGRCDYFLEELEVISNFKKIGKNILAEPDIDHINAPWASAPSRYLITGKGRNSKLLEQVNHALETVIKSGTAKKSGMCKSKMCLTNLEHGVKRISRRTWLA